VDELLRFADYGIDLAIMAALIYIIEIKKWNSSNWTQFFVIPGRNPLFIYLLSELLVISLYMIPVASGGDLFSWINRSLFQKLIPGAVGSLLFAISFMMICWGVGWLLDRKRIYVRV
jgi:predicted acyltransferase